VKPAAEFRPTGEQLAIMDAAAAGENLVVEAGAGCGKTKTAKESAQRMRGRGRYLTFNRAAAEEAKRSFPPHVKCSTIHSLAWPAAIPYAERGRVPLARNGRFVSPPRQPGAAVAEILRIVDPVDLGEALIKPAHIGRLAVETLDRWCRGIDRTIDARHVPKVPGLSREAGAGLASIVVRHARRAWKDVVDLDGSLNVKHDYYLRMWWDGGPHLPVDFILVDEAQDSNPLAAAIVQQQRHAQLVGIGDSCQQLYGWRGAENALASWPADRRLYLTQSWRFGRAVADEGNKWLELLDTVLRLKGAPGQRSRVEAVAAPDAVLCRTNAGAMAEVMTALAAGKRPALAGGAGPVADFAEAAMRLQAGKSTSHPDLFAFPSWEAVEEYVDEEEGGADLRVLVQLVNEYTPEGLLAAAKQLWDPKRADVLISTAHRAKGLEWRKVRIGEDFKSPGRDAEGNPRPVAREFAMLAYVAVTRARGTLDRGGLAWVDEWVEAQRAGTLVRA
jgi:superfamily I DNA/RNA helicase